MGITQSDPNTATCDLCYANDMVISADTEYSLLLYADDSTILFSYKDPAVNKLGKVLEYCSSWLVDNRLSLHLVYSYTTLTNFSTKYLVMCKVYTDVSGIK